MAIFKRVGNWISSQYLVMSEAVNSFMSSWSNMLSLLIILGIITGSFLFWFLVFKLFGVLSLSWYWLLGVVVIDVLGLWFLYRNDRSSFN